MTIIVTGGAGFIGSNFIFYELDRHPEDRIVCIDKLTYAGNLSTLAPVMDRANFRFVKMDICDREGVYKLFEEEKPDIVVNFAAESHVDRSIENPEVFLQTNIIGTSTLMDAANTESDVIIRFPRTRSTATCLLTAPTCSSRKRPRFTPAAPTAAPRHLPTCSCWLITGPMAFRHPSAAAPTITDLIISRRSLFR